MTMSRSIRHAYLSIIGVFAFSVINLFVYNLPASAQVVSGPDGSGLGQQVHGKSDDSKTNANRVPGTADLNMDSELYYYQGEGADKAPDGDTANYLDKSKKNYIYQQSSLAQCNDIIVITGEPGEATSAKLLERDFNFNSCRVKRVSDISLDSGFNQAMSTNRQSLEAFKSTIDQKAYTICQNDRPDDITNCEKQLKQAFEDCSTQLGGGSGNQKYTKVINQSELANCMAQKTGLSTDAIDDSLTAPISDRINPQCDVYGIGWLICQVSKLMAKITDGAFEVLKLLLKVPGLGTDTAGGQTLYQVWSQFRNVANIVFVLIFLYVIYSQLTGLGTNNYGIKRLLPRLIMAIILTNISYFICAVVIDITNVLGASLRDLIMQVALPVKPEFNSWNQVASASLITGGGIALYLSITALFPVLVSGLLAILMTIILLIARQAIIVILIILAPVAFVLNTLPNTQKWFERWWSSFFIVAMMYPIIAVIYGGSQVAAGVISSANPDQTTMILFAILALGVQAIPFFTIPLIMKAGGGVFERFTGVINNPSKGVFDRVKTKSKEKADEWSKKRDINAVTKNDGKGGNGLHARLAKRRANRDYAGDYAKNQIKGEALKAYTGSEKVAAEIAEAGAAGAVSMSNRLPFREGHEAAMEDKSRAVDEIKSSLEQASIQVEVSDISAEQAVFADSNYSNADLENVFKNGLNKDGSQATEAARAAAAQQLAREGKIDRIHDILRSLKEMEGGPSRMMRQAVATGISQGSAKNGAAHLRSTSNMAAIQNGSAFEGGGDVVDKLYHDAARSDAYNSSTVAMESSQSLRGLRQAVESGAVEPAHASSIRSSVAATQASDRLKTKMSGAAKREAARF